LAEGRLLLTAGAGREASTAAAAAVSDSAVRLCDRESTAVDAVPAVPAVPNAAAVDVPGVAAAFEEEAAAAAREKGEAEDGGSKSEAVELRER